MGKQHDRYVKYIEQSVDSVCPYKNSESEHRLYHIGFLSSYLAQIFERDPYNLKVFESHIERIKRMNKQL